MQTGVTTLCAVLWGVGMLGNIIKGVRDMDIITRSFVNKFKAEYEHPDDKDRMSKEFTKKTKEMVIGAVSLKNSKKRQCF